jgi:hypothetical protein
MQILIQRLGQSLRISISNKLLGNANATHRAYFENQDNGCSFYCLHLVLSHLQI